MTTQLTRPEPLELEITAAEYDDLENWLPLKLAELEHTEEHQQRLAWWQEYGIQGVILMDGVSYSTDYIDLELRFRDGFINKLSQASKKTEEQDNNSTLTNFSLLPLKLTLEKLNQQLCNSPNKSYELQQLSIGTFNKLAIVDLEQLAEHFPTIKVLVLVGVLIEKDSLIHLRKINQLSVLVLWDNNISARGASELAKPLTKLTRLTDLDLKNNEIDDDALQAISIALITSTKLKTLRLSQNPITDLTPLLPLIKRGMEVNIQNARESISIRDCPITTPPPEIVDQGREAILNYFEERLLSTNTYKDRLVRKNWWVEW